MPLNKQTSDSEHTLIETDREVAADRPSQHAVVVPVKQLMDDELERLIERVRERDNVGRGEAFKTANGWLQSQIKTDLLANIELGLYRIWYSRSKHGGDFEEVAIWFEGTLYNWPSTSAWLCNLLRERLCGQCQSIGTFFRTNEHAQREALEIELEELKASVDINAEVQEHTEIAEQCDARVAIENSQDVE